jgi:outer membrane immunogenic protein
MQRMGVEALYRCPRTTKPEPGHNVYPYLLRGLSIGRPNQVRAMDITHIAMVRGFVYLAVVLDRFSRRVSSWRLSITMEAAFCVETLEDALARYPKPEIFNTPRCGQVAAYRGQSHSVKKKAALWRPPTPRQGTSPRPLTWPAALESPCFGKRRSRSKLPASSKLTMMNTKVTFADRAALMSRATLILWAVAPLPHKLSPISVKIGLGTRICFGGPMRKVAILIVALTFSGSAFAADMAVKAPPPPVVAPVYNWTGFYVGIEGGGGWGRTGQFDETDTGLSRGAWNISGGLVGGTAGYNWETGNVVFGLESDMSWTNIIGQVSYDGLNACKTGPCFTDLRWLNTDRARIGYAANNVLWYATGGLAIGDVHAGIHGCPACVGDTTRYGWTAGGGVEWAFASKLSVKLEYLYVDLGNKVNYSTGFPNTVDATTNIVRAGLNYKFN